MDRLHATDVRLLISNVDHDDVETVKITIASTLASEDFLLRQRRSLLPYKPPITVEVIIIVLCTSTIFVF